MVHQAGLFIVGTTRGLLQAVDATTGAIVWQQHPARSLEGAAGASSRGSILLLYPDGYLEGRNPLDGAILWEKLLLANLSVPYGDCRAIASQAAVAFLYGRTVAVIRPTDGALLWSYRSSAYAMSLLAITDEHLYLAETSLEVARPILAAVATKDPLEGHRPLPPTSVTRAYALLSGIERWNTTNVPTVETPGYGGASLIEDGDTLYVYGSNIREGGLYALEAETGSLLWRMDQPIRRHRFGQLVKWHEVIACNALSTVVALDSNTHQILWQADLQTSTTSLTEYEQFLWMIVSDDRLYLGRRRSRSSYITPGRYWIEARDPLTGTLSHTFPDTGLLVDPEDAGAIVYTGRVFALPSAGSLYAFDPSTGRRLWAKDFGDELAVIFHALV